MDREISNLLIHSPNGQADIQSQELNSGSACEWNQLKYLNCHLQLLMSLVGTSTGSRVTQT